LHHTFYAIPEIFLAVVRAERLAIEAVAWMSTITSDDREAAREDEHSMFLLKIDLPSVVVT
jgi:electron transfer flavoprotein alpha/beta subunit